MPLERTRRLTSTRPRRRSLVKRLGVVGLLTLAAASPASAAPYERVDGDSSAKRVVIVIHGGSWTNVGKEWTDEAAQRNRRFARWGYRVVSPDYRAGTAGLEDVLAVYDAERARAPRGQICIYGESAGGHWALMVAAQRPTVDCVISAAGPADLLLARIANPLGYLAGVVRNVFGRAAIGYSPAQLGGQMQARLLLEFAETDSVVPSYHGLLLSRTAREVQQVVMRSGDKVWMHGVVDRSELRALRSTERGFLAAG